MSYRFENLEAWKQARIFVKEIYRVTVLFPSQERFALTDQIRRAAISIVLNIAEGSDRKSDTEFIRFLRIALTSINEVVSGLYIALDLSYLKRSQFDDLYVQSNQLSSRIHAFIKKIKSSFVQKQ